MTDRELYDFTLAIDYQGVQHVLDPPIEYAEWMITEGRYIYRFRGLPEEPGIYRVTARRRASGGFVAVRYESMRLVGSGEVVAVVNEAEDER